jgi:hypothetical protein
MSGRQNQGSMEEEKKRAASALFSLTIRADSALQPVLVAPADCRKIATGLQWNRISYLKKRLQCRKTLPLSFLASR